ncbi:MAG: response regulator [Gammaproteobacteria bacterium]|nr:response regulator [Gammaproteobacteria bacterium]
MSAHILIAEDEPYIVDALSFVFDQAGYTVVAEPDGAAVIQRIRDVGPGIVILDLMLPNKNGFEILKELKGAPDLKDLPVLVLTARGQSRDRATAEQLGADAFISKPFSNQEVLRCVEELLGKGAGPGQ